RRMSGVYNSTSRDHASLSESCTRANRLAEVAVITDYLGARSVIRFVRFLSRCRSCIQARAQSANVSRIPGRVNMPFSNELRPIAMDSERHGTGTALRLQRESNLL